MRLLSSLMIGAVLFGSWSGSAAATSLNLVTGLSQSMAPGTSALLDIAATNEAAEDITTFNAFLLSFQLLPQPGATGSLAITTIGQPATNALLTDPGLPYGYFEPAGSLAPGSVNGSSSFVGTVMANDDFDLGDVLAAGATANLLTLTLTADAGSEGIWTLYAITNSSPISAWQAAGSSDDIAFGNLPIPEGGSFSSLPLGTVSVAPVPEPAAMLFPTAIGIVVVGVGRHAVRRCGRRKASSGYVRSVKIHKMLTFPSS